MGLVRTDLDRLNEVRRAIIVALFSEEKLTKRLVLKGGNAIDLIHDVAQRSSEDLDFSLEGDFAESELPEMKSRLWRRLSEKLSELGFEVFDLDLRAVPEKVTPDVAAIWGGYDLTFKLIDRSWIEQLAHDLTAQRKRAIPVGLSGKRTFVVQMSRHEFCGGKRNFEIEKVVICAYTPEMIVAEKLRAICQQMKEYEAIVPRPSRSPRARDFFDLCTLIEICGVDVRTAEFARLLRGSFAAKRVPLRFLSLLPDYRAFHEPDFVSVERTVKPGIRLQGFDHYFDRVLQVTNLLEPLWVEEPPLR